MYHAEEDYLAATHEILSVHVSGETRRTCPMGPEIQARLGEILKQHEGLALPPHAGRSVGLKRKPV
jgi:acyl-CoA thioester hydrolase